jgi:hypothetical protein
MSKTQSAAVFGFTGDLTFAVASMMQDLRKYCIGKIDEVVCIHDGNISKHNQNCISKIFPTRFIKYKCPISLSRINKKTLHYFSKMVLSKYECLRLLDDYKRVTFFDYDMEIIDDISPIFDSSSSKVKMILDGEVRTQLHPEFRDIQIPGINMSGSGMCASLFSFDDSLLGYADMYQYLYDVTEEYGEYLFGPEQFGFSLMLQHFGITSIDTLEPAIYSLHPRDFYLNSKAKILHAYGQPKYWNGFESKQWSENYGRWLAIGGSPYKRPSLISRIKRRFPYFE